MEKKKKWFLGLDMGTSSVGWAVTDENYNLMRAKGKDLWGIREFDTASTAESRRINRTARRRRERSKIRIGLIKSYFDKTITEVDSDFFIRLDNSKYFSEDKDENLGSQYALFKDANFTDKDYYKKYPTIFHLRSALIHDEATAYDARLVYLAILNIFKHRGHFLNAGVSADNESDNNLRGILQNLFILIDENTDKEKLATNSLKRDVDIEILETILASKDYSRTNKAEKLAEVFNVSKKNKMEYEFVKAFVGLEVNAYELFPDVENEEKKKQKINFSSSVFEETLPEIYEAIGEEYSDFILAIKQIYDCGALSGILGKYQYLSDSRIKDYEQHKEDLKLLKKVYKKYKTNEDYNFMFRSEEEGSYGAYVKSNNSYLNKDRRSGKGCNRDDIYSKLKMDLKDIDDKDVIEILDRVNKETFLPKQLTADNGVIPYQVHYRELNKILNNAEKYLPFLKEKDDSGLTVSERIKQLFAFQIPYYVGPLTEMSHKSKGNGWVVRKEKGQVLPWNINEKINLKATNEEFINRMVRRCTYLAEEQVLPKESLEYQRYCVLNEINNIKLNDEKISVELKQAMYNDLFKKGKRVTRKKIFEYLYKKGLVVEDAQISGIDITINNALTSYGKIKNIIGEKIDTDSGKKFSEDVIFWCTVYGDSKHFLKEQLTEKYGENSNSEIKLLETDIKKILGFKFKDWGRMSKEMLELPGCEKSVGEEITLIRALWETNMNFMELINSDKYTFKENLADKQVRLFSSLSDFKYEDMDDMYFSAPVKRMIWQTTLVLKELIKVIGCTPERIFLEMTRTDQEKGDKGRKDSRAKTLSSLYKTIKDDTRDWQKLISEEDASGRIRSKKMYLYLRQMGKDMYTGEIIDLNDLFDDNKYDIDHIYPRHFVKDDNLENNMVLVNKQMNIRKSDTYPLDKNIRTNEKTKELWKVLRDKKLINDEKYRRLTRINPFTPEEQANFIARQLVETSQGTKGIADLLKQLLPDTELVYAKAKNVSDFRNRFDIPKSRLVNDFHHAHDAYLNIVVGNVYLTKFTHNPLNFIKNEYMKDLKKNEYHLTNMFEHDVIKGQKVAWIAPKEKINPEDKNKMIGGTIDTVNKVLTKNTPLMTRMVIAGHGQISDATLYSANKAKADNYIPIKVSDSKMKDVTKYGGLSSVTTAYFCLAEYTLKNKKIRSIEAVPIIVANKLEKHPDMLEKYIVSLIDDKATDISIRIRKIPIQSLVKRNGYFINIAGKTGNSLSTRNNTNLILENKYIKYIHVLEKDAMSNNGKGKTLTSEQINELYSVLIKKHNNGIYSKRPNSVGELLLLGKEKFEKLGIDKQKNMLIHLLQLTAIGPTIGVDLSLIGGAKKSGVMFIGKKISDCQEFKLINQSPTGLFSEEIDLLTV